MISTNDKFHIISTAKNIESMIVDSIFLSILANSPTLASLIIMRNNTIIISMAHQIAISAATN
jgi:hypothetical protein